MMKMNVARYWFTTFTIVLNVTSMTVFSGKTHLPIIRETNEIAECEDKDGNIPSFKYKKIRITPNCYEVSTNVEKLKMCRKKKVIEHCSKTCAACVDEPISSGFFSFFPIKSSSANWNESDAFSEVEMDLERLGSYLFSEKAQEFEEKHKQYFNDYQITREKTVKKVSYHCKVLAELLQKIPDVSDTLREKFYVKMIKIALMIDATYMETESYIEGVKMRGWPFKIGSKIYFEFDSYQGSHLMEAAALAAEQAAIHGDTEIALSLALKVAAALHDGFLTKDLRRTKVRSDGQIVYVPKVAPEDRRTRFREVWKKWSGEASHDCPGQPQALNHGLMGATAGVSLLRAFGAIGWLKPTSESEQSWNLSDADGNIIELQNYVDDLKRFVKKSSKVLLKEVNVHKTGDSSNDNYAGKNGTIWYKWKYRNMKNKACPVFKKESRPEDIDHAKVTLRFATIARAVGYDYFGQKPDRFGITSTDVHHFIISVLNRYITDLNAKVDDRFTCDLNGETDPNSKSCNNARKMPGRVVKVSSLLTIANAARDYPEASCDVLSLVKAILPVYLEGHEDFHGDTQGRFKYDSNWHFLIDPLMAKYNFYWYENGLAKC